MTGRTKPHIKLIWAEDRNGILGTGESMCWRVPADFGHFKSTTMGSPIIMGRASFDALGKALPGRTNIVITRQTDYKADGAIVVHTIDEAFRAAKEVLEQDSTVSDSNISTRNSDISTRSDATMWVTGGSSIYNQTIECADELVVTYLDLDVLAKDTATADKKAAATSDNNTATVGDIETTAADNPEKQTYDAKQRYVYAPDIDPALWIVDKQRSDDSWREKSGDARWKVVVYIRAHAVDETR